MTQENQALDLNGLASGADGRVAAMLAELEGNSLSASEAGTGRSMWTRQFAASGKVCQPTS
jgi:hypothetical protein